MCQRRAASGKRNLFALRGSSWTRQLTRQLTNQATRHLTRLPAYRVRAA